jgi:hypothetical protein
MKSKLIFLVLCAAIGTASTGVAQTPLTPNRGTAMTGEEVGKIGKAPPSLGVIVKCPATIAAGANNAPAPWQPGGVSMNVQSATLTDPSAPTPQMICKYAGSGAQWQIYRNIQPEFKTCSPSGTQFICSKP